MRYRVYAHYWYKNPTGEYIFSYSIYLNNATSQAKKSLNIRILKLNQNAIRLYAMSFIYYRIKQQISKTLLVWPFTNG